MNYTYLLYGGIDVMDLSHGYVIADYTEYLDRKVSNEAIAKLANEVVNKLFASVDIDRKMRMLNTTKVQKQKLRKEQARVGVWQ